MSQIVVLCPVSNDEIANLTFFTGYPLESPHGARIFIRRSARGLSRGYRHSRGHKSNTSWLGEISSFHLGQKPVCVCSSTRLRNLDMGRKWSPELTFQLRKYHFDVFFSSIWDKKIPVLPLSARGPFGTKTSRCYIFQPDTFGAA